MAQKKRSEEKKIKYRKTYWQVSHGLIGTLIKKEIVSLVFPCVSKKIMLQIFFPNEMKKINS
jgi:hypothetical protein